VAPALSGISRHSDLTAYNSERPVFRSSSTVEQAAVKDKCVGTNWKFDMHSEYISQVAGPSTHFSYCSFGNPAGDSKQSDQVVMLSPSTWRLGESDLWVRVHRAVDRDFMAHLEFADDLRVHGSEVVAPADAMIAIVATLIVVVPDPEFNTSTFTRFDKTVGRPISRDHERGTHLGPVVAVEGCEGEVVE
jgi:hypothetical protein